MTPVAVEAPATAENAETPVRQLMTDTAYLFTGLPIAVASSCLALYGLLMGVGSIIFIGIPILVATLLALRFIADLERRRVARVLRTRCARPVYDTAPADAGAVRRLLTPLGDVQSWLDVLHSVVILAVSIVTFAVVLTWWTVGLAGVFYGVYGLFLPESPADRWLISLIGFDPDGSTGYRVGGHVAVGMFFLVTVPFVTHRCAVLQARLGQVLLGGVGRLHERISGLEADTLSLKADNVTLEDRRLAAVSAEVMALRRLERDIHDGPQQRLVRLAVDIGRAEHLFETDPQAARRTMAEALAQTEETLNELRALSRGIAPPILTDRGLVDAVAAIAGRCTVPVSFEAEPIGRLDPAVEATAYFVIAEALANVAKHSAARECAVRLERLGDRLFVTVVDDGAGGAHPAKGHGLAGLADRAHAAGGRLTVTSPSGGPTTIAVELPWR